jgi:hypothetical protein
MRLANHKRFLLFIQIKKESCRLVKKTLKNQILEKGIQISQSTYSIKSYTLKDIDVASA